MNDMRRRQAGILGLQTCKRSLRRAALVVAASLPIAAQAQFPDCWPAEWTSAVNGAYISTEIAYGGDYVNMLRARSPHWGPWEEYEFCYRGPDNLYYIRALVNRGYVSAEIGYPGEDNGMLRARATDVGPWELFRIDWRDGRGVVALQSNANGRYVSAEYGFTGDRGAMLRARATEVGPWELFNLRFLSSHARGAPKRIPQR
ncbi:hypothetical protein OOT46_24390 [Aquabacterium sp. A7-Y]|uniref:fascin domain-containing protein n=1 Tax=Aquabacterium sp. A7-Y TaxID=1349605 RepID=UPI00223DB68E|nr:hypothetical protein [Aquabacterium sp. A7-Y]MCW7540965.1 hypothetical protein [Aquabacterium sp. A7-Y]